MNRYSGSNFDDFLHEESILEEVSERARKQLLTLQIKDMMADSLNEEDMEMLNRVVSEVIHPNPHLDPDNTSITVESSKYCDGIETLDCQF